MAAESSISAALLLSCNETLAGYPYFFYTLDKRVKNHEKSTYICRKLFVKPLQIMAIFLSCICYII